MRRSRHLAQFVAPAVCLLAGAAAALQVDLPVGAQLTAERISALDGFNAPVAAFDGAHVPAMRLEGQVERRAWRISSEGLTPLQVMAPLRMQLQQNGFDPVFECEASGCGGFDFRFNVEVLPAPNMYVNIADYRYLTAVRGDPAEPQAAAGVLVSVTRGAAYVQMITVASALSTVIEMPEFTAAPRAPAQTPAPSLGQLLLENGHAALPDLEFATGTSALGPGPYAALGALADFMETEPKYRVLLVGHTDTVGGLDNNIALSRARARAVRQRLIEAYGVDGARLDAEGMGYLAPTASNLTATGRQQNRRVEAVLLSPP